MERIQGKAIFHGIAIGKLSVYGKKRQRVKRQKAACAEHEKERYFTARDQAAAQLREIYKKAVQEVGELNAQIFQVHAMMLEDDDYNESVLNMIATQGVNAEYAVAKTGDNFAEMFAAMEDEYFKARSADIRDISDRVLAALTGAGPAAVMTEPVILAAYDLAPSETIQLDKRLLLAFVTEVGSTNSHTAILARSMNIPALTGIRLSEDWDGKPAAVDGDTGTLYIEPDEAVLETLRRKQKEHEDARALLLELKNKETITGDGRKVHLYANIGSTGDLASVLENDAEGIGLFRTEFLYLEKDHFPTEQEQFQAYKTVVETMAGRKVIFRTLDIGADKQVDYFGLDKEENPAMGYRAIRICLDRTDIFKTQLRAILRASAYGSLAIMFPMIISKQEILEAKRILEQIRLELEQEGLPYRDVEVGIMIETPAAAIISDELAGEVDFFSIGTNDLTQYVLAADRQNPKLDACYDAHHPAVLRLIEQVVQNGHAGGAWVGICGELGADTSLTEWFVQIGVDELSVTPSMVLPVRKVIRDIGRT
ncbi:MAG: phosphoenolpyruvate--protein phosphotransferase [Lachnospiraceae bacterium]